MHEPRGWCCQIAVEQKKKNKYRILNDYCLDFVWKQKNLKNKIKFSMAIALQATIMGFYNPQQLEAGI